MSFTDIEGVIELVEHLLRYSWPKFLDPLPITFNRMSYRDAMEKYGCDKPDTRFDFQVCKFVHAAKNAVCCDRLDLSERWHS